MNDQVIKLEQSLAHLANKLATGRKATADDIEVLNEAIRALETLRAARTVASLSAEENQLYVDVTNALHGSDELRAAFMARSPAHAEALRICFRELLQQEVRNAGERS